MSEDRTPSVERANTAKRDAGNANARNRKEVLLGLLGTPSGRKFLWNELAASHLFEQTYVPGSFDGTAFNEGMRAKGLKLFNEITQNFPGFYIQMTKENASVQIQEEENSDE